MLVIATTAGIFGLIVIMTTAGVFLVAMAVRDNSIMDIAYGPTFLIATASTIWLTESFGLLPLVATTTVAIWSARLGLRILHKNVGKPEDARYAAWREAWQERGQLYFIVRSYLQIYLLQGLIITVVALPVIFMIAHPYTFTWWSLVAGILLWCVGLGIEATADWQLDRFIARKKAGTETANLMTSGLFRYSRRPNYFGESLLWWGLALIVLPLPYGFVALLGPLTITYIVTNLTGPMLERIFLEKYPEDYRAYMERTSYFIPLPPRVLPKKEEVA